MWHLCVSVEGMHGNVCDAAALICTQLCAACSQMAGTGRAANQFVQLQHQSHMLPSQLLLLHTLLSQAREPTSFCTSTHPAYHDPTQPALSS